MNALNAPLRLSIAVLLVAMLLIPAFVGGAAAQQKPFGINAFGQGSNFVDYGPPSQNQQDIGVQWSRVGMIWATIQPDGTPDRTPTFTQTDSMVDPLVARGIEVVGLLTGTPMWASTNPTDPWYFQYPPASLDDWEFYVRAVVDHYKDVVDYWEVWNEPNFDLGWRPAANANDYFALYERTWQAIKGPTGVDPDANVVLGGLSGVDMNFLDSLVSLGAWPMIDVVAIHPYDGTNPPDWFGRIDNLLRLRAFTAQHGAKPIWYTEVAWPSTPFAYPGHSPISLPQHADYLVRDYVQSIGLGADRNAWWNLREDGIDPNVEFFNTGLMDFNMVPKPAYTAYATMTSQLGSKAFQQRRVPFAQSGVTGFETADPWAVGSWAGGSGSFTRDSGTSYAGSFSGAWTYSFPPMPGGAGALVNLHRNVAEAPLPGVPTRFNVWVKADNGDHKLSIEFKDAGGEIWRAKFGFTIGTEWRLMTAHVSDATNPFGGDGTINYPVSFHQFYLENFQIPEFPFFGTTSGTIYLDELTTDEGSDHVYDYQFASGGGDFVDVIWTTDEGATRPVPFPTTSVTVTNDGGSSTPVSDGGVGDLDGAADGVVTIGATTSPRFVAWQGSGYYVLDRFGGVHPGGGVAAMSPATPYFGFDAAQDLELAPTGFYVLDRFGGIHAGGGAAVMTPSTPYWGFDVAQDLELAATGYYVLDRFGGVHAGGGAPTLTPATPHWGFDVAQDLELASAGYYVLDRFGGVHPGGGAGVVSPTTPYWGFDIAQDLELTSTGYYVLDRFGGIHLGGSPPVASPTTPYFGFEAAQDLEFGATGYYVLDRYGLVHPGGGASAITPATPYWGWNVAKNLEIR